MNTSSREADHGIVEGSVLKAQAGVLRLTQVTRRMLNRAVTIGSKEAGTCTGVD